MQDQLINSDQFENRAFAWFCSCLSIVIRKMFLDGLVVHLLFKRLTKRNQPWKRFTTVEHEHSKIDKCLIINYNQLTLHATKRTTISVYDFS